MALVPFALFVEGLDGGPRGAAGAARGGFLLGVIYFGLLLHWLLLGLWGVTKLALLAWPAVVALLGLVTAGAGWALHGLRRRAGAPLWLALPLAWTGGEWLRGHLPGGLAFPWLGLGTSLTAYPRAVGMAELVGARGVTFWIALVGGIVSVLVVRARERRPWLLPAAALVLTWTLPPAWGVWRAGTIRLRPVARVAAAQTEIPQAVRFHPLAAVARTRDELAGLDRVADPARPDLLVWPETAFPVVLSGAAGRGVRRFSRSEAGRIGAPVLVGAFDSLPGEPGRWNATFLVDSGGATGFTYRKRRLVPVVERAPWVPLPSFFEPPGSGGLRAGDGWPVATLSGGGRFGVLICYESAFPGAARSYRRRGADFLVNVTNDAWLGGAGVGAPTTAAWQHPAHLVMRAIEERMGVVRSANGGFTLFVDPLGRVYERGLRGRPSLKVATVYTTGVRTLYSRTGDWVGPGAFLATLLLLLVSSTPFVPAAFRRSPR